MALVIGSLASHILHPEMWITYNDVDLVIWDDEFQNVWLPMPGRWTVAGRNKWLGKLQGHLVEVTTVPRDANNTNVDLLQTAARQKFDTTLFGGQPVQVCSMGWLYVLKYSHRFLKGPHFEKTRRDIHLMESLGEDEVGWLDDPAMAYKGWLARREAETYTRRHPNLNVMKRDFFSDAHGVHYIYDHDSIHKAMALENGVPAYEAYKEPGAEVMCSKDLWDRLPQRVRLNGVLEECYVLALERSQIPHPGESSPRDSFRRALQAVCTTVTSGWFRDFAYEEYFTILRLYNDDYVLRFEKGLNAGIVKKAAL